MTKRILIVEDEDSILIPLQFLMEQNGYEVMPVRSGEGAIDALGCYLPHLVLLDIMLPRMDGYEVCQAIRSQFEWQHIKIVMVSAKGSETNVAKGMDLGADAYITKPFSNAEIVSCVKRLLDDESEK